MARNPPNWPRVGEFRAKLDRALAKFGQGLRGIDQTRPKSVKVGPKSTTRNRPKFARSQPASTNIGQDANKSGPHSIKFGPPGRRSPITSTSTSPIGLTSSRLASLEFTWPRVTPHIDLPQLHPSFPHLTHLTWPHPTPSHAAPPHRTSLHLTPHHLASHHAPHQPCSKRLAAPRRRPRRQDGRPLGGVGLQVVLGHGA